MHTVWVRNCTFTACEHLDFIRHPIINIHIIVVIDISLVLRTSAVGYGGESTGDIRAHPQW